MGEVKKLISITKNLKRGGLDVSPDTDRRTISQMDLKKEGVSM